MKTVRSTPVKKASLQWWAVQLSRAFHPFIASVATLWLAMKLSGYDWLTSTLWTLLSFAIVILPILLFILVRVRQGRYKDADVSMREDRPVLYALGGGCMILTIILLAIFQAPVIAQKTLQAGFASIVMGSLVNKFFNKVSLHVLTVAGCAILLFFVSPVAGIALGVISLLIAWSRLHLSRHTLPEVVWGWLVGVIATTAWMLISQNFYPTFA
jgi:membrane-associated phospholipid phosphatase